MRKTDDTQILEMLNQGKSQKEIAEFFDVSPAAICKRVKRLAPMPDSLSKLTEKEQKFAISMAEGKNQTQAALASFECGSMASAKSLGSQLAAKNDVQAAISDLMQEHGLTRSYRIGKLKKLVDHTDPGVSLKALDQSWKLEGLYADPSVSAPTFNYNQLILNISDTDKEIARLEAELRGETNRFDGEVVDAELMGKN